MQHFCHAKRKEFVSCKSLRFLPTGANQEKCAPAPLQRVCPGVINLLCFVICQYAVSRRVIDLGLYCSLHKPGLRLRWLPLPTFHHQSRVHGSWEFLEAICFELIYCSKF